MNADPAAQTALLLQLAIAASGVGAFVGGYALMRPSGSGGLTGMEPAAGASGVRALGGALLLGHAASLATLAQSPAIGSCLAAGLGSAWFGAAAGRAISALIERRGDPRALVRVVFEAVMGVLMWAPLWNYLRLIRHAGVDHAV